MTASSGHDGNGNREKIVEVFSTILQCPAELLHDDAAPSTLERWDSFQHLVLVAGFEEEFGIEIEPEEIDQMFRNFGAFRRIVEEKLSKRSLEV